MATEQRKTCNEKLFGNMTADEFQNKLYVWFEEKGVLSELRTHLRHQMIEALKTTEIGRKVATEQKLHLNLSPKYQALNLIIAEYLLHQGFHYALSVFSSEVPMLSSLPTFTHPVNPDGGGTTPDEESWHVKFKAQDTWDILEALGLPIGSDEANIIHSFYQSNVPNDTLLLCLIRMLPAALRNKEIMQKKTVDATYTHQNIYNNQIPDTKSLDPCEANGKVSVRSDPTNEKKLSKAERVLKKKKKKILELNISSSDITKSSPETSNDDTESKNLHLNHVEFENTLAQIHKRMQRAFDHELEVARQEEWEKCRNVIENREQEIDNELQLEKAKIKSIENRAREKVQSEVQLERIKLTDEMRVKHLEMEKSLAKELELERCKLLYEYKTIFQNKGEDAMSHQQIKLELALDKIQTLSNRLKEKEDLLNRKLNELENNFPKINNENISKDKQDIPVQNVHHLASQDKNGIESLRFEIGNIREKIEKDSQSGFFKLTIDKAVQTACSKNVQTSFENSGNIESDKSIKCDDDFQKLLQSKKRLKSKSKNVNTDDVNVTQAADEDKTNLNLNKNFKHDESSLSFVLKTLHDENTYLKSFTNQQRQQITELITKQMCMGKEVSEANAQVQELSAQLTELGKCMKTVQSDKYRIKSAPVTFRRKKWRRDSRDQQDLNRNDPTNYSGGTTDPSGDKSKQQLASSDESELQEIFQRRRSLPNSRKAVRKTKNSNQDTRDSQSSPIDDVLKEARKRLKMLELESDAVDRSYQEFKQKRLKDTMSFHLKREMLDRKSLESRAQTKSVCFGEVNSYAKNIPSTSKDAIKDLSNSRTRIPPESTLSSDVAKVIPFHQQLNVSPAYNVLRRVHEPTMNIDKNVLQSYIATVEKLKHSYIGSRNIPAKFAAHEKLLRNIKSVPDTSFPNKFSGTTAFLLERIENCSSSSKKFTPKRFETKRVNISSEHSFFNRSKSIESQTESKIPRGPTSLQKKAQFSSNNNGNIDGSIKNYLGHSNEHYRIKPLPHHTSDQISIGERRAGEMKKIDETKDMFLKNDMNESQNKKLHLVCLKEDSGVVVEKEHSGIKNMIRSNQRDVLNSNEKSLTRPLLDRESVRRKLFISENLDSKLSAKSTENNILETNFPKENGSKDGEKLKDLSLKMAVVNTTEVSEIEKLRELTESLLQININVSEPTKDDFDTMPNQSSPNKVVFHLIEKETNVKSDATNELETVEIQQVNVITNEINSEQKKNELKNLAINNTVDDCVTLNNMHNKSIEKNYSPEQTDTIQTKTDIDDYKLVKINKENKNTVPELLPEDSSSVLDKKFNVSEESVKNEPKNHQIQILIEEQKSTDRINEDLIDFNDVSTPANVETDIQINGKKNNVIVALEETEKVSEGTGNEDLANDTLPSEELIVPSSIDMSSDQSPISAPQVSDENESFWN